MATGRSGEGIGNVQPPPVVRSAISSQVDDTYEVSIDNQGISFDPVDAKKTFRKIDFRILTILFFIYSLWYLDKNGTEYASAFGLVEELLSAVR